MKTIESSDAGAKVADTQGSTVAREELEELDVIARDLKDAEGRLLAREVELNALRRELRGNIIPDTIRACVGTTSRWWLGEPHLLDDDNGPTGWTVFFVEDEVAGFLLWLLLGQNRDAWVRYPSRIAADPSVPSTWVVFARDRPEAEG